jgi:hypothetical protein
VARADAGKATAAYLAGRRHALPMARLTVATSPRSCADAAGAGRVARPSPRRGDPLSAASRSAAAKPSDAPTRRASARGDLAGPAGDAVVGQVISELEPRGVRAPGIVGPP